jgi:tRNA A-37 threonylcarbamoyl transferase component Bud32
LRVAVEWHSNPERIHREALGLRYLAQIAPAGSITPFVFEDFTHHLLAMQAVPEPHQNFKMELLAGHVDPDRIAQFGHILGSIQQKSRARAQELEPVFADRQYFESLRVEPYYEYTSRQLPKARDFLEELIRDTREQRYCLVHGDYSPKNVLVFEGRLVLIDHEVIHWGDGAFDTGFALTHLLSKAHKLAALRPEFLMTARTFWAEYCRACGGVAATEERRAVRHTLACLLARAAGRSPLEYLDTREREQQVAAALSLTQNPPATMDALIVDFVARL